MKSLNLKPLAHEEYRDAMARRRTASRFEALEGTVWLVLVAIAFAIANCR